MTAKHWFRELLYRSYSGAKLYRHLEMRFRRPDDDPILIYQMGKVGSTTIVSSLRQTLSTPIVHVHFLTEQELKKEEDSYRKNWNRAKGGDHVWEGQYLRHRLPNSQPARQWRVITLVRDPVARNVSDFFQTAEREFDLDFENHNFLSDPQTIDKCVALFLDRFERHDLPLTWFDDELHQVLDIDVFMTPFPTERGFQIYENERFRVLLLRLEDLEASARPAFSSFLGLEDFALHSTNTAEKKPYAGLYRRFLEEVRLPQSYLSQMYDSKYARQFYTQGELGSFRERWSRSA